MKLAKRIDELAESATLAVSANAARMKVVRALVRLAEALA